MASDLLDRFKRLVTIEPETAVEGPTTTTKDGILPSAHNSGIPGEIKDTPYGPVRLIRRVEHLDYPDALPELSRVLLPETTRLAGILKDPRLAGFDRNHALFLDVESTSLSHGAGNVAFLVGLGFFEGNTFVVEQYFMDDFDQEMAQLHCVLERLKDRRYLVSYNGKSFDKSILESRFVIQRFMDRKEAELRLLPHLDLLHVGRRVLGGTLARHNLATVEEEVLGFHRQDDVPGSVVPQIYFGFLMNRDESLIGAVIDHNYWDIVSLAYLAHLLLRFLIPGVPHGQPTVDRNVGRLFLEAARPDVAVGFLESALDLSTDDDAVAAANYLAQARRKLNRDWSVQESIWRRAHTNAPDHPTPCEELSKCLEWGSKDKRSALHWAREALQRTPGGNESIHKRIQRLQASKENQSGSQGPSQG